MAKEIETKVGKKTITLTFDDDDESLYDELVRDAKSDRRTVAQHTLLFLVNNYNVDKSATE